jgi:L-alanine-DL-glutamate epimerase-like enolase superfamily enzyme
MALAAADVVLWEGSVKGANNTLVDHLGLSRPRIHAHASRINLNRSLDARLDRACDWNGKGNTALKAKVGEPVVSEGIERLTKVRPPPCAV